MAEPGSATPAAQDARKVASIMSLTPAGLAGRSARHRLRRTDRADGPDDRVGPGLDEPADPQYTQAIMNLTFAQLAAGAAGQP